MSLASNYTGYKGLPELVGIHSMEEAITTGLTVSESVERLKRYHWTTKRLSLILISRITSMPVYELKMAFSLHAHLLAEQVEPFFNRVREMREPPYGMDDTPHAALDVLLDEMLQAPTTEALVIGVYQYIIPSLVRGLERHIAGNNNLFDHPTYRICKLALSDIREISDYGQQVIKSFIAEKEIKEYQHWIAFLQNCLDSMGDVDGTQPVSGVTPEKFWKEPYLFDFIPKRDERFNDGFNMRVNAEALLLNRDIDALPKTLMLYFKRMREINVPEMMASIVHETKDKPWNYYREMIRQIWDEARHAMMGEVGFTSLDIDWKKIPMDITWPYLLNTRFNNKERHSILFFIEQGLMPAKTGKKYEWEVAVATTNRLTALIQDYDWADEVLHARIGKDWIVPELGGQERTMEIGNKAWEKALSNMYDQFEQEGKTKHANWWPEIYREACTHWGIEPDPAILNFDETYRDTRADQKIID
jgi:hypothetical protein